MSLFRLDASIFAQTSSSRELADIVEAEWSALEPGAAVVRRDLAASPLPSDAWANAITATFTPEEQRSAGQRAGAALAAELVDELVRADALLFALPMYNYGVSQHFKAWADLVIADPRMAPGRTPAIAGTRAVLVSVQGGNYAAGSRQEGWDHALPWTRHLLETIWKLDLEVVTRRLTLVGVDPSLDQHAELAAELKTAAADLAGRHGRGLGAPRQHPAA